MATRTFGNDFMEKVLKEEAWKRLSWEMQWNEALLEKYQNQVQWKDVSRNQYILWSPSMLEKFKSRIDWDKLSESDCECLFTEENLEKYKDYWHWEKLSQNTSIKLTDHLLDKFAEDWVWKQLIDRYGEDELYDKSFLEKYRDRIPASELQQSRLWDRLVEKEKESLKVRVIYGVE